MLSLSILLIKSLTLLIKNRKKKKKKTALTLYSPSSSSSSLPLSRDGNGVGRVQRMGSTPPPYKILSCPIPAPHDRDNFITPSPPLGAPRSPTLSHKTLLLLLICLITSTIFLMKPISLIKIYSKLQLNLSHKIKSNQF